MAFVAHLFPAVIALLACQKRQRPATAEVAIYEAIKAMPDLDLSEPATFTTLPFPSLLPMPFQRFEHKKVGDINHFEYMGRLPFRELHKRIQDKHFITRSESLYLSGTSGSGKSHLLAALAYNLIREGKRVFYIPDCCTLLLWPEEVLWQALEFAFYDSDILETIGNRGDVNALIRFISEHEDLYIIIDQVNVLLESERPKGCLTLDYIHALRFKHPYIFSAEASEIPNHEVDTVFRIFGGMSKVC